MHFKQIVMHVTSYILSMENADKSQNKPKIYNVLKHNNDKSRKF